MIERLYVYFFLFFFRKNKKKTLSINTLNTIIKLDNFLHKDTINDSQIFNLNVNVELFVQSLSKVFSKLFAGM